MTDSERLHNHKYGYDNFSSFTSISLFDKSAKKYNIN